MVEVPKYEVVMPRGEGQSLLFQRVLYEDVVFFKQGNRRQQFWNVLHTYEEETVVASQKANRVLRMTPLAVQDREMWSFGVHIRPLWS